MALDKSKPGNGRAMVFVPENVGARPVGAPALKEWMLQGKPPKRSFRLTAGMAYVSPLDVARGVVADLLNAMPEGAAARPLWALMPVVANDATHDRYKTTLSKAIEGASGRVPEGVLFEPEMVLEYFRLGKGAIQLKREENASFLVIDCGALTCNMVWVTSTTKGTITGAKENIRRTGIAPVGSDNVPLAGAHVNAMLGKELRAAFPALPEEHSEALVEHAKLTCGDSADAVIRQVGVKGEWRLTAARLRDVSEDLWEIYEPTLKAVLGKAFDQMTKTEKYEGVIERRELRSADDLPALLRGVVLAGGTSRLPGFEEPLLKRLNLMDPSGTPTVPVLRVGGDYPAAAAVGAALHVLDRRGLLEIHGSDVETDAAVTASYQASLPDHVDFAWRFEADGARESSIPILDRDTPIADLSKDVAGPMEWSGRVVRGALVWRGVEGRGRFLHQPPEASPAAGAASPTPRSGPKYSPFSTFSIPKSDDPVLAVRVTRGELRVTIAPNSGGTCWHDFNKNGESTPADGGTPATPKVANRRRVFATAAIPDFVLDFGMSKLLAAESRQPGEIDLSSFARLDERVPRPTIPTGWSISQVAPGAAAPRAGSPRAAGAVMSAGGGTSVPPTYPVAAPAEEPIVAGLRTGIAEPADGAPTDGSSADSPLAGAGNAPSTSVSGATGASPGGGAESGESPSKALPEGGAAEPPPSAPINGSDNSPAAPRHWIERITMSGTSAADAAVASVDNEWRFLDDLHRSMADVGFEIPRMDLVHLHLSAKVTSLVLLTGPPGVGKSALARRYAMGLGILEGHGAFSRIAVEASWTDSRQLLHSGGASGEASPYVKLAARAWKRQQELFAAVLDECNLAHMDYYMAPLLSAMEDDGKILVDGHELEVPMRAPHHRMVLLGTMNVDDAGTPITDKVLDRASLVELAPEPLGESVRVDSRTQGLPRPLSADAWRDLCNLPDVLPIPPVIGELWKVLNPPPPAATAETKDRPSPSARLVLGKRIARQIAAYHYHAQRLAEDSLGEFVINDALDLQVLSRVLPRLSGDDRAKPLLRRVREFCESAGWGRSTARILRMEAQLAHEHSFSFWTS